MRVPVARKSLGQHFLADRNIAVKIVKALKEHLPGGTVVELGPGGGALTGLLLEAGLELWAIEVDRRMISLLRDRFPQLAPQLVEGDFLKLELNKIFNKPIALVGNFPYNISSQIVLRIFEQRHLIPLVVGMFQREMARRLTAPSGNKDYGILSVLVQATYQVEYLFEVGPQCFIPPPKVYSAVVRMRRREPQLSFPEQLLRKVLRAAFGQRRKQLGNSLRELLPAAFPRNDERLKLRPEQLSVEQWLAFAEALEAAGFERH
ncbi:MAG: 16S rRNA (adenine(1518)-N(6)/adenine(1519)-N(6))-dimethyltransferase RsmA [Chitinophagales bacterium]|nr:16S rRNA (adenine(1518)-N(6)/adenine(1519)-N(6))-dimethyltransferase RsmA [Chitinophagales bacterium]MDW8428001.1 16S rRNA (adenine(1518)-N(6)/adenine(1519)-N(6))-dimethyltransferase RsmA [Chitinophagales bacterium]